MYFLLSGEGAGDIGICNPSADACDRPSFSEGPMAIIVDQLVEALQGYEMSHLSTDRVSFVSKAYLVKNKLSPIRKAMSLKGKKKPAETKYYFENARALAAVAKAKSKEVNDNVVAILFRDSDGTASAKRGNWINKRDSMIAGFLAEEFNFGVPMIPKPKSEAWLLCATKEDSYQHCNDLENESGNDNVNNSLKDQLENSLGGNSNTNTINQLLYDSTIDALRIDMTSFNVFKDDLRKVVSLATGAVV